MKRNIFLALSAIAIAAGLGAGIARFSQAAPLATHAWSDSQLDSVYIRGSFNDWKDHGCYKLTYVGDTKDGDSTVAHMVITLKLNEGDEFKICYGDTWANAMYTNDFFTVPNNIKVNTGKTGYYTIHFRTNFASQVNYLFQVDAVSEDATKDIYFVDGAEWGSATCHYWNNENDGTTWPGATMTATNFKLKCKNNEGVEKNAIQIYKLAMPAKYNFVIFSNSGASQTGDLFAKENGVYFFDIDAGKYEPVVNLLLQVDGAMKSGSYDSRAYSKTICGMDNQDAASIKTAYLALNNSGDAEVVTSIEGSTLVTNDYSKSEGTTATVTLKNVYDVLSYSFPKGGNNALSVQGAGKENGLVMTLGIAAIGLAAGGTMVFLAKRRKEI